MHPPKIEELADSHKMSNVSSERLSLEERNVGNHRNNDDPVVISRFGDLILKIKRDEDDDLTNFRVDSSKLKGVSKYFDRLLDPDGYQEGRHVAEKHRELQKTYKDLSQVPALELPHVRIEHVGQISEVKTIKNLMTDFLRIIHGYDVVAASRNIPSVNIANLAIVADRFDSIAQFTQWSLSKRNITPTILASQPEYDEDIYRQRLLTCLLLNKEARLSSYSQYMILKGSSLWYDNKPKSDQALWWQLPRGLEEELQYRHECILEAILSLQDYLLGLYTSKSRQCRLGYDTSPQCDSFQLGEFVKFLSRVGTLNLQVTTQAENGKDAQRDIRALIKELLACPSYQVDPHHTHCGPKKQLVVGLEYLRDQLTEPCVGVCLQCWDRCSETTHLWTASKRPLYFNDLTAKTYDTGDVPNACDRLHTHEYARDLFTADERNWEALLQYR